MNEILMHYYQIALQYFQSYGVVFWKWLSIPLFFILSIIIAKIAWHILARILKRITLKTSFGWDEQLLYESHKPVEGFFILVIFWHTLRILDLKGDLFRFLDIAIIIGIIIMISSFLMKVVTVLTENYLSYLNKLSPADSWQKLRKGTITQVIILRRIIRLVILIIAVALCLMQFDVVRQVGISLLASAGIAGVVIGFAAQKSLGSILGGVQLAFTQPLRIGDRVIFDNESGDVEQIHLTFTVLKLWDKRRMVIPNAKILETPFITLGRSDDELIGAILFYTDFSIPIDKLKDELKRILADHPLWDKKNQTLQVIDTNPQFITLRVTVSAQNISNLWDLRCDLREKMITFISGLDDGKYLPKRFISPPINP